MGRELGHTRIEKIFKLEAGIYKRPICSWLMVMKILGDGPVQYLKLIELLLESRIVRIVDMFLNFIHLEFQILQSWKRSEMNNS